MENMENRMNEILNNPEMMQKIMTMAQTLQKSQQEPLAESVSQSQEQTFTMPDIDIGMLQKLSVFAGKSGVDKNQQNLLQALGPYLSQQRVGKLEKAMRAAKMAKLATAFIGQSGAFLGR